MFHLERRLKSVVLPVEFTRWRVKLTPTASILAKTIIGKLARRAAYIRRLSQPVAIEPPPEPTAPSDSEQPTVGQQFRAFLRLLRPHDALHVEKARFGSRQDGGYVMLDDLGQSRMALSLGIGSEASWDLSMVERGLHVVQFDDAVSGPPQHSPGFSFNRARVVGQAELPGDVTLAQILARSDLAGDNNLIVKIDIEGWEWEVLRESPKQALTRVRQITIEFHEMARFVDPAWRGTALATVENLLKTHACIHIHGNNCAPFAVIDGVAFPSVFEATFVRRSDYALIPSTAVFPTELDYPNNPGAPDHYIGHWTF